MVNDFLTFSCLLYAVVYIIIEIGVVPFLREAGGDMSIGDIIKRYRAEHDLSLREFADRCNISHSYIAKLEAGIDPRSQKPVEPTVEVVSRIAAAMGMTLDELLRRSGYIKELDALDLEEVLQRETLVFRGKPIGREATHGIVEFLDLVQGMSEKRKREEKAAGDDKD